MLSTNSNSPFVRMEDRSKAVAYAAVLEAGIDESNILFRATKRFLMRLTSDDEKSDDYKRDEDVPEVIQIKCSVNLLQNFICLKLDS